MEENKKKFDWKFAGFVAVFIMLIFCLAKINELENQISNLSSQISGYQNQVNSMQNTINSIYDNVDEKLKKEASLLSNVDYSLGELNTETHMVPVTVTLTPKSLTDDMQVSLSFEGNSVSFERNGSEFTATFPINMFVAFDEYPMLNIKADGTTKTELLESVSLSTLYNRYLPLVYAYITPFDEFKNNKLKIDAELQFDEKPTSVDSDVTVKKVELVTEKNNKEISRKDITGELADYLSPIPVQANYDAKYGDEIIIYVVAEDSLGYVHKLPAYYWHEIDENTSQEAVTPVGDNAEIYDKNGNLLTGGNK